MAKMQETKPTLERQIIMKGNVRILRKLGAGSFGEIWEASKLDTGELYAVKAESKECRHPQLRLEYQVYQALNNHPCFAKVYAITEHQNWWLMMMDKLGESLETLFTLCGRKFSIKTTTQIAIQILHRIEALHKRGFLHRDIKPDNFVIGGQGPRSSQAGSTIYLLDFGLCKKWRENGIHIQYKEGKRLTGTPRYASINTHQGIEQSRRDDLESLGYMLMYFVRGKLPWQGLKARNKQEKYYKIGDEKKRTSLEILCREFPVEFKQFLQKCRSLEFTVDPPYEEYRALFRNLMVRKGWDANFKFDWQVGKFHESQGRHASDKGTTPNGQPAQAGAQLIHASAPAAARAPMTINIQTGDLTRRGTETTANGHRQTAEGKTRKRKRPASALQQDLPNPQSKRQRTDDSTWLEYYRDLESERNKLKREKDALQQKNRKLEAELSAYKSKLEAYKTKYGPLNVKEEGKGHKRQSSTRNGEQTTTRKRRRPNPSIGTTRKQKKPSSRERNDGVIVLDE